MWRSLFSRPRIGLGGFPRKLPSGRASPERRIQFVTKAGPESGGQYSGSTTCSGIRLNVGNAGSAPTLTGRRSVPRRFSHADHCDVTEGWDALTGRKDGCTVRGKLDLLFRRVERGRKSQPEGPEKSSTRCAVCATRTAGDDDGRGGTVGLGFG